MANRLRCPLLLVFQGHLMACAFQSVQKLKHLPGNGLVLFKDHKQIKHHKRGRGRATKQDGRLERELRAEAVPEGRRGREDSRTTHRVRCPSTPTTAATQNHVRGPRRSGTQGRKLATRPRPIRPDKRGGVASSEDRGRRARSSKEQAEQAAGTAGAVTTRISLQHQQTPVDLRPPTERRGDAAKGCGPFDSRERNPVREVGSNLFKLRTA
ncbi:hypothetical protein NDU88_001355 [Pleurodeles waltl]|uniref:Secreted protein n=1 Tax=Pleurodeles waltl TaxID=8319 RepID=A0AAV7WI36_PLEWA|nr:hypothetical protein NDU88_001355 [Pleurodeles waltl]